MKTLSMWRYQFRGSLFIPKEDTTNTGVDYNFEYEKDITFDFSGSSSAPRSVIIAREPFPTLSRIDNIRNKHDEEIMEGAEFTVTSVEVMLSMFGRVDGYKHLVALRNAPNFGYDVTRP